ncbi:MAG: UDP-N-acetylmuramoyl-tripeptide--D-alanyl-D-alanine ligase [Syntrophomonadaceae bacterium]|jgi:UDP-N-acetylmuramoyl-tripeptide--D-alanyl-D-alanine ligase|nr:UDP-N-acetylmuramoyl-tripeptide--D-alanyl-D-alanine ligase [Syntrophomonadaceae bacterium]
MNLSLEIICAQIKGKLIKGPWSMNIQAISTDSRNTAEGSLFFALAGENFDGHDYVVPALQNGASAAVISRLWDPFLPLPEGKALIMVEDTLQALQDLARYYRSQFPIPLIAVTGSVGKTTTKEMIYYCLSSKFNTLKTEANFNNDIGVPLTLFRLEKKHQCAVLEMAMRGPGEILRLVNIARPTCSVITNVEKVHLEKLGQLENIAQAKCEILAVLNSEDFALINGDHEILVKEASRYSCRQYTFGYKSHCDFQIKEVQLDSQGMHIDMDLMGKLAHLHFGLPARPLAPNIAASAGVAFLMGLDPVSIQSGLDLYQPYGNRLNIYKYPEGGALINDTYNANPISMAAALETARAIAGSGNLVAVLGDMFELGDYEQKGHIEVGQKAWELKVDTLITVGDRARFIAEGAKEAGMPAKNIYYYPEPEHCLDLIRQVWNKKSTIVFKASRAMELEKLVDKTLIPNEGEY